jgi:hypothetical protein
MAYQYWAVVSRGISDAEPVPRVLLRTEFGVDVKMWAPSEGAWVDAPMYFDLIYGDDPDSMAITEAHAQQLQLAGVGLDADALGAVLAMQVAWRRSGSAEDS